MFGKAKQCHNLILYEFRINKKRHILKLCCIWMIWLNINWWILQLPQALNLLTILYFEVCKRDTGKVELFGLSLHFFLSLVLLFFRLVLVWLGKKHKQWMVHMCKSLIIKKAKKVSLIERKNKNKDLFCRTKLHILNETDYKSHPFLLYFKLCAIKSLYSHLKDYKLMWTCRQIARKK